MLLFQLFMLKLPVSNYIDTTKLLVHSETLVCWSW